MWHLSENINAIPVSMLPKTRQALGKSWLLHLSEGESDNQVTDWVALPENDEDGKVGLVEFGVAYEKSVPHPEMGHLPETNKKSPAGIDSRQLKASEKRGWKAWDLSILGDEPQSLCNKHISLSSINPEIATLEKSIEQLEKKERRLKEQERDESEEKKLQAEGCPALAQRALPLSESLRVSLASLIATVAPAPPKGRSANGWTTKPFHRNDWPVTNKWAPELIAKGTIYNG
jgi:hypothetical protein